MACFCIYRAGQWVPLYCYSYWPPCPTPDCDIPTMNALLWGVFYSTGLPPYILSFMWPWALETSRCIISTMYNFHWRASPALISFPFIMGSLYPWVPDGFHVYNFSYKCIPLRDPLQNWPFTLNPGSLVPLGPRRLPWLYSRSNKECILLRVLCRRFMGFFLENQDIAIFQEN